MSPRFPSLITKVADSHDFYLWLSLILSECAYYHELNLHQHLGPDLAVSTLVLISILLSLFNDISIDVRLKHIPVTQYVPCILNV